MLSLINYYYIRLASPPLKPIKSVRGIYLFYHPNTKRRKRDVCVYISKYLLCLGPSYQALSKGTTPLRGDKENHTGYIRLSLQQYYGSTASDRMLRGRSAQGLGGAVYLLVRLRSFVRRCKVVDAFRCRSGGCYRMLYIHVGSYRCLVGEQQWLYYIGVLSAVVFEISPSHIKTFHYAPQRIQPPGPPARCATSLRWL